MGPRLSERAEGLAGAVFALAVMLSAGKRPVSAVAVRLAAVVAVAITIWGVQVATIIVLPFGALIMLHLTLPRAGDDVPSSQGTPLSRLSRGGWLMVAAVAATIAVMGLAILFGSVFALAPVLAGAGILLLLTAWGYSESARSPDENAMADEMSAPVLPALAPGRIVLWALVAVGWAAAMIAIGTAVPAPTFTLGWPEAALTGAYHALASILSPHGVLLLAQLLWLVPAALLIRRQVSKWEDELGSLMSRAVVAGLLLGALGMIAIVPVPGIFGHISDESSMLSGAAGLLDFCCILAALALLAFAMAAPYADNRSRLVAQGLAAAAVFMALLSVAGQVRVLQPAEAGYGSAQAREVSARLTGALGQIDAAMQQFAEDTGCYCAELADLARSEPPARGLDASGNEVELAGGFAGPYLPVPPVDPLTGRRDTWVYEVTGAPMATSGGYTIELERTRGPQTLPHDRRRDWRVHGTERP